MDNDERKESTLKSKIDEKAKNKLKDFNELKCLYNLSNDALRFKRNISLIIQERVEKSLNKIQTRIIITLGRVLQLTYLILKV